MFMKKYTAAGMQQVGTYKALSISCTSVGIRFCGPSSSFIFLPLLIHCKVFCYFLFTVSYGTV